MAGKHTPGPWVWALDGHNQYTSLRRPGTGEMVIHPEVDLSDYALSAHCWNDLSKSDAALIEAAPALLEALTRALPYVETAEADEAYKPGEVAKVTAMIRAAIRQAEGEE